MGGAIGPVSCGPSSLYQFSFRPRAGVLHSAIVWRQKKLPNPRVRQCGQTLPDPRSRKGHGCFLRHHRPERMARHRSGFKRAGARVSRCALWGLKMSRSTIGKLLARWEKHFSKAHDPEISNVGHFCPEEIGRRRSRWSVCSSKPILSPSLRAENVRLDRVSFCCDCESGKTSAWFRPIKVKRHDREYQPILTKDRSRWRRAGCYRIRPFGTAAIMTTRFRDSPAR